MLFYNLYLFLTLKIISLDENNSIEVQILKALEKPPRSQSIILNSQLVKKEHLKQKGIELKEERKLLTNSDDIEEKDFEIEEQPEKFAWIENQEEINVEKDERDTFEETLLILEINDLISLEQELKNEIEEVDNNLIRLQTIHTNLIKKQDQILDLLNQTEM